MARRGAAIATLRISDATVVADDRTVARNVSLDVADGTLCAVIGPSGAGKTTLLRIAAGLVAHSGTVWLDDRDVTHVPTHRRGVAMLFQEPRLFDSMTVLDNVAYAARARRVPRRERRGTAMALLEEVGLAGRADERPTGLSGGERQRIALARALNASPHVLLLDEPLSALDATRRAGMRAVIASARRARRLTAVYVSHDLADAVEVADHIAVVIDGRLVQHDTPTSMLERPASPEVARFTGNPNVLMEGSTVFTVRPEHVELGVTGTPGVVVGVGHRVTHDLVQLESPWGTVHALVAPGRAPAPGVSIHITLPACRRWTYPPDVRASRPSRSTS